MSYLSYPPWYHPIKSSWYVPSVQLYSSIYLQSFDAVVWMRGRSSGLWKTCCCSKPQRFFIASSPLGTAPLVHWGPPLVVIGVPASGPLGTTPVVMGTPPVVRWWPHQWSLGIPPVVISQSNNSGIAGAWRDGVKCRTSMAEGRGGVCSRSGFWV